MDLSGERKTPSDGKVRSESLCMEGDSQWSMVRALSKEVFQRRVTSAE